MFPLLHSQILCKKYVFEINVSIKITIFIIIFITKLLTMKTSRLPFKLFFLLIILPYISNSQEKTDSTKKSVSQISDNYSSIIFSSSYTNNNLEYLPGVTEKIPTLFSNISYIHKSGIYAGVVGSNYFNTSIQTYEYSLQIGYQKYFDNGFDIDFSYGTHKFSGDSLLKGLDYKHSINSMLGYELGKFYFSNNITSMFGETNNLFIDFSLSHIIQFNQLFFKNDVCLINPTISFSLGTDSWIYENMTTTEKSTLFSDLDIQEYSHEKLSYEGFSFFLPISYGINNTYITFSYLYRIPSNKYEFLGWEKQSGIMLSLTYFLNFNKK